MSGAVEPLDIKRVVEPRVDINSKRAYAVLQGGREVSNQQFISNAYSDSNITFDCNPPDVRTIVDKKVWFSCSLLLTFTQVGGSAGVAPLNLGQTDAPRAYPLAQIMNTLRASINNTTVSIDANAVLNALLWYNNDRETRRLEYSETPAMLDQSQSYQALYQQNRNPLGRYGQNDSEEARGGFQGVQILSNPPGGPATVLLTCREPLFLSPFLFGTDNQESGFVGVNKMQVYMQLGNLKRAWSRDALSQQTPPSAQGTVTLTSASIVAGASSPGLFYAGIAPTLEFTYITPKELTPIPKQIFYPYFEVIEYSSAFNTLAPQASATQTTNAIFLSSIPRRIYFWIRASDSYKTTDPIVPISNAGSYTGTDTFAFISNISVKWGNRVGLFSSASAQALHHMSVENGCRLSWNQWSGINVNNGQAGVQDGAVGSVIAMEPGKDIGLDDLQAPGVADGGQYFLQVTCTYQNLSVNQTIPFVSYITVVNEGTILNEEARSVPQIGVITRDDVLRSRDAPKVPWVAAKRVYGSGDFWSNLKSFAGKVIPFVEKAVHTGQKVLPIVKGVSSLLGGRRKGVPRSRLSGRGLERDLDEELLENYDSE
jgi:hypothetical protein